jgi:hypothetical protein
VSPERFPHFSEEQATEVAAAIDSAVRDAALRNFKVLWKVSALMISAMVIGACAGVWAYSNTLAHRSELTAEQRQRIAQTHHDEIANARQGLANCRRAQDGRTALALAVHTAIPPHSPTYDAATQERVDAFYAKVGPGLEVPPCPVPAILKR